MDRQEGFVMRRQTLLVSTLAFALLAPACPPEPQPPQPDSGDAAPPSADAGNDASPPQPNDTYGKACAALAKAGCSEGLAANCHDVMKHAEESRLTEFHQDCLATKCVSKASCRACSRSIACP